MHPLADTGRVIAGRYRLEAPIGRGAMGVVWRARDQLLDRDVAVKEVQIAETLTDAERANAYQRTLREAKTAARLNHPAVVTVYDVCEDEGRPWIVMQLVSAQSLDQVLAASGPLSPRRAAEMARQLLSALSVAHAAGVMHRDVKPSNVLLGSDDRAVLTDFGIATFQGDPKLTQTGMVMGSPGFTAPERIRGEDASPASDLWSLGATLFAAVEGHGPFEKRGGAITTMSAIINEDAPEAPAAGALGPVIAALLRREPADRPDASAATRMINDVLPLLAERPPAAPAGYEATALSASSRPAPPQSDWAQPDRAQPDRASLIPQPGYPSLDHPSLDHPSLDRPSLDHPSLDRPSLDRLRLGCLSRPRPRWTSPQPSRRSRRSRRRACRRRTRWRAAWRRTRRPPRPRRSRFWVTRRVTRPPAAAGGRARAPGTHRGPRPGPRPGRRDRQPDFSSWYDPVAPIRSGRPGGIRLGLVRVRVVGVPGRVASGPPVAGAPSPVMAPRHGRARRPSRLPIRRPGPAAGTSRPGAGGRERGGRSPSRRWP